jgi:hypothetical protein
MDKSGCWELYNVTMETTKQNDNKYYLFVSY